MVSLSPATLLLSVVSTTSWSVETRVQSAKVLGKFFVVLLSLLNNFMFNFMLNGSSTSLLVVKVDIRVQNAGLLRKYFVVLLRLSLHFPKVHQVMPLRLEVKT
ncbi:hypothetical protein AHAS_Ahas09G0090200 [Arachis hypogaea]